MGKIIRCFYCSKRQETVIFLIFNLDMSISRCPWSLCTCGAGGAYSEHCQICKVGFFAEIVYSFQPLTMFAMTGF